MEYSGRLVPGSLIVVCIILATSYVSNSHAQTASTASWDGINLWSLNNVNSSTVSFPSSTSARFSNMVGSPDVARWTSLTSKNEWVVDSQLTLLVRAKAWNYTIPEGFAWQLGFVWSDSAVIGYGAEVNTGRVGIMAGGECVETQSGSVLAPASNYLGQWLIANLTLDGPTQTEYFSIADSNGNLIGQISSRGYCGTMFGTQPVRAYYFTEGGAADIDWIKVSSRSQGPLLFDDFVNGQPTTMVTWDGISLWNLNNVVSSVWFPNDTTALFSNYQTYYSYSPLGVSITSSGQWTVQNRLVLLIRVMALNYTRGQSTWYGANGGADAWRADLDWGSAGSANIGYGTDSVHSPNTGLTVGGECIERTPQGVLTTSNLIGQWITANITLSGPTQTIYFSAHDSNGNLLGQSSETGFCGSMFGTLPVNIDFWTYFGTSYVDRISLTSGNDVVLFDDFTGGQANLPSAGTVGGSILPLNVLALMMPYGIVSAFVIVAIATVCTALRVKRGKRSSLLHTTG